MPLIAAVRECETCPVGANAFLDPRVGALIAAGGLAVMTLLIVVAAFLRYRDRQIPEWLIPTTAFAYGVGASLMVLLWPVTAGPVESVLFLALGFGPALLAAWSRRFDLAGWILVGAGLLPLLWWGYYVVRLLSRNRAARPGWRRPRQSRAQGAAAPCPGRTGPGARARDWEGHHRGAPLRSARPPERALHRARGRRRCGPEPGPRRVGGAGRDRRHRCRGSLHADCDRALLPRLAPTTRSCRGHARVPGKLGGEALPWTTGRPVPTSIPLAREWLARQPETDENRWARPEFLALVGEIDEAYQVLGRMPSDTDDQRFERQSLQVFLDTLAGAAPDVDGLAAAAEEIGEPRSDERLRAVAAAAIARSRLVLARGEKDWTAPLLEAQARIGPRSLGIMRSDTWLHRFRVFALAGVMVIVIGTTISWAFR